MLKISDFKNVLRHIITNNRYLQTNGKKKNTIAIESNPGIGKTSAVLQLAQELNLNFAKINLAQCEQVGDIVGFPIRSFEYIDGEETKWINEIELRNSNKEMRLTGGTRTDYCQPSWVPREEKGTILLLDDYNRAAPHIIAGTMELLDRQEFIGWTLPKDTHIVLSMNPENGDHYVTPMDNAQKTRFIKLDMKFDINEWAQWAELEAIDSRCINFLLLNPELIKGDVNARIATDFFNSICSLPDFSTESAYYLIQNLGSGSVGESFAQLFIMFINNRLDRLPHPEKIIKAEKGETAIDMIKHAVGVPKTETYKQNIASLLSVRLSNFVIRMIEDKTFVAKEHIPRLQEIILSEIFTNDINFNFIKTLNANPKLSSLIANPKIAKMVMR
jgi:DNA polymerase III delta prime subunit